MHRPAILLIPLLALACGRAGSPTPASKGLFIEGGDTERPYFYDFGEIQDGARPTHVFRLLNTEPDPVTLHDILPSCSCVVPVVRVVTPAGKVTLGSLRSKGSVCVIPPSAFLEIEVAIDTTRIRRKNADRLSTIRLRSDSPVTPFHTLEVHVKVQQLIQATPWVIDLGEVATSEGGKGHTDVVIAVQDAGVKLRTARSLSPELTVDHRYEQPLGRSLWIVDAVLEPGLPQGPWEGSLQLIVDAPGHDPPEREVVVPVRARVVADIVMRPRRVFLMRGNERGVELTVNALVPGTRFVVNSATLSEVPAGLFTATASALAPDIRGRSSTWKILINSTGSRPPGDLSGKLTVTLDDGTILEAGLLAR